MRKAPFANQLVPFDIKYYVFPNNLYGGYFFRAPSRVGLDRAQPDDRKRRLEWLQRLAAAKDTAWHRWATELAPPPAELHLRTALLQHGLFAERFFFHAIRSDALRAYFKSPLAAEEFDGLASQVDNQTPAFSNDSDRISYWMEYVYDQLVTEAVKDPSVDEHLGGWFVRSSVDRPCLSCGRWFRLIDRPAWAYFGSNGCPDVCLACPVGSPAKAELRELVRAFVRECGFTPSAQSGPIVNAFTSRFAPERLPRALGAYAAMGGIEHVKAKFGSWFEGLAASGALPAGVLVSTRGVRCLAADGHVCHSFDEQKIDNWLAEQDIKHEREPSYPQHIHLNPRSRRRADWSIQGTYVEYFGLVGDKAYETKMEEKIQLASATGIRLVELYASDLRDLNAKLGFLRP